MRKTTTISKKMVEFLGHSRLSGYIKMALAKLLRNDFVEFTIPDKPRSRMQKYRLTEKGKAWLEDNIILK